MKMIGVVDLLLSIMAGFLLVTLIQEIQKRKTIPVVSEYVIPDDMFNADNDCSFIISSESDINITYTVLKKVPTFDGKK